MQAPFLQTPSSYYDEFVDPFLSAHNAFFIRAEHLARYIFAKRFIQQKKIHTVYDIACGDGYGTKMLSSVTKHVYGFDNAEQFVEIAKSQYSAKNITYVQLDLEKDALPAFHFPRPDIIVSFETLEHVEDPRKLLQNFFDILPATGHLLLSTPNAKLEPKKKGKSRNVFHKNIFQQDELIGLLKEVGFEVVALYGQPFTNILLHNKFIRDILNKITERSLFLFSMFSFLGYPNKLFNSRSYSMIFVARKK